MRKAIGLDQRRDPARSLAVIAEVGADIVALQECDRRFGSRASAIPPELIARETDYIAVAVDGHEHSLGWHGNAILVKSGIVIEECHSLHLPTLEPRGAVVATVRSGDERLRIVGMHLDLSGVRRRHQARAVLHHLERGEPLPSVLMGDLNEWRETGGCLSDFARDHRPVATGRTFHTRHPVARLDRIFVSPALDVVEAGVHHSATAARASDHLPVWATLAPMSDGKDDD